MCSTPLGRPTGSHRSRTGRHHGLGQRPARTPRVPRRAPHHPQSQNRPANHSPRTRRRPRRPTRRPGRRPRALQRPVRRVQRPATAERLAHAAPGTVLPFAFDPDVELVADPEVAARTKLYFNAARLDRTATISGADYARLAQPRIEHIASPAPTAAHEPDRHERTTT
ncbi:YbaK/EbsC family protein [Streptomyces sp. NPDC059092]|uniref:YbaK/EbsC family protein n=1 Tax=Streptomyces sp. NPDC059092 TaxID=3346725 RepID=UPI0036745A2A